MVWIKFHGVITLSTLATDVLITAGVLTFGEDFFCVGVKATWSLRNVTVGQGPIDVGFNHGELSVLEIGEAIQAEVTDPDDIALNERARRPVRNVGTFDTATSDQTLNDGAPIVTRFKRSIGNDHDFDLWALNRSGANLTTGAQLHVNGHLYGRWQR